MGRYATGVKVMRLNAEDKVVTFTRAEHDEEAQIETVEAPSAEDMAEAMKAEEEEKNEVIEDDTVIDD